MKEKTAKMKILQVTHFGTTTNYGAVLQAFALQRGLRLLGHEVVLLRAKFSYHNKLKKWYRSPLRALKAWLHKTAIEREERRHPRYFEQFLQDNLFVTEKTYYRIQEVKGDSWEQFDAMVTGSDQVWSNKTPSELYFLNFGKPDILRFSYAASFGSKIQDSPSYCKIFLQAVQKLSGISVREYGALDLCKRCNVPATIVPDPVFLFSGKDYESFFHLSPPSAKSGTCLIYLVGQNRDFPINEVLDYCRNHHLSPVLVSSQNHLFVRCKNVPEIYPCIHDWIQNIRDASLVITDSFHGTCFSLLFGKHLVIYKKHTRDMRFDTLEQYFGIGATVFRGDFQKAVGATVDYGKIQEKIVACREKGFEFLKRILESESK